MSCAKGYTLDSEDRLTAFWGDWGDFDWSLYLGRSLWSVLSCEDLSQLLTEFFRVARARERDLLTSFRCGSLQGMMELQLRIQHLGEGKLECELLPSEPMEPADLESSDLELSHAVLCSWCGKAKRGADWVEIDMAILDLEGIAISHGLCESCSAKMMKELASF